ncbi:MAG: transcription termination factor Rho, partial [Verrucomicrobia bacterium]|nr:transcription termination factor Rho [Verrucomicrobiota bacterium]
MNNKSAKKGAKGAKKVELENGEGYLEIAEKGFGFLRSSEHHFSPKPTDIFVTPDTIKRNYLREGSFIKAITQPPHRGNNPQLNEILEINGMSPKDYGNTMRIENLTTIDPIEKFKLETTP